MSSTASSPAPAGVSFDALLRYNELETAHWREWLGRQPDAVLDFEAGDPALLMGTARGLLFHIFIVEWVYAKTLKGEPWAEEWKKFDRESRDGLFAIADEAQRGLRSFAASATPAQLAQTYTISSQGLIVTGSGRKFLVHIVFHSARHWAQMAMLMRQRGHKTDWQHDFVLSDAME